MARKRNEKAKEPEFKLTSVSITIEQDKWLRENLDFNLSEFVRKKLEEKMMKEKNKNI